MRLKWMESRAYLACAGTGGTGHGTSDDIYVMWVLFLALLLGWFKVGHPDCARLLQGRVLVLGCSVLVMRQYIQCCACAVSMLCSLARRSLSGLLAGSSRRVRRQRAAVAVDSRLAHGRFPCLDVSASICLRPYLRSTDAMRLVPIMHVHLPDPPAGVAPQGLGSSRGVQHGNGSYSIYLP
jgi:hypothetical protein